MCDVCCTLPLCYVPIVTIIQPLHVLLLDQLIDVLLDASNIQHASLLGQLDDFGHKIHMLDLLLRLHDAHDCSLRLEVLVFEHTLVGFLVLFLGLLELDLVDLDSILLSVE